MPSKSRPVFHTRIETYAELERFGHAFAAGHLNLLVLLGPPGVGKSRTLADCVGDEVCWMAGSASCFGIYVESYKHRDQPLILDDIDGLTRDPKGVRLLKALCQTDSEKSICWHTHAAALDRYQVPQSFKTKSHVAIVANTWFCSEDVQALEDRGHVVEFDPPPLEVHRKAAEWFWDQEVFDFVGAHLSHLTRHSLRVYVTAWERKQAGLPWQSAVVDRCLVGSARDVAKLKLDPRFRTEEERVQAFIQRGLGCRATYFNYAKKLRPSIEVPYIVLSTCVPPKPGATPETAIDILRRRGKNFGYG